MPNNPRLYVDLLRSASGVYASWQPSQKIEVGDYGTVNKMTCEFEKEGSIYDAAFEPDLKISDSFPPEECPPDDQHTLVSRGVRELSFGADAIAKLAGLVDFELRGHWKFANGRGAILVMHRPKLTRIQYLANLLPSLRQVECLSDKALVTSVFSAPRYAMLLTQEQTKKAEALVALVPTVANSGEVNVSAGTSFRWLGHSSSGVWKSGGTTGEGPFYPLYSLRTPKSTSYLKRLFASRPRNEENIDGEDAFYPYQLPWSILDEDGDEIDG